jgi:hypothetical protein
VAARPDLAGLNARRFQSASRSCEALEAPSSARLRSVRGRRRACATPAAPTSFGPLDIEIGRSRAAGKEESMVQQIVHGIYRSLEVMITALLVGCTMWLLAYAVLQRPLG